jgi:hypothetical protein
MIPEIVDQDAARYALLNMAAGYFEHRVVRYGPLGLFRRIEYYCPTCHVQEGEFHERCCPVRDACTALGRPHRVFWLGS